MGSLYRFLSLSQMIINCNLLLINWLLYTTFSKAASLRVVSNPNVIFWKIDIDPENHQLLVETNLPTPMTARVYVKLPEGNHLIPSLIPLNPGWLKSGSLYWTITIPNI